MAWGSGAWGQAAWGRAVYDASVTDAAIGTDAVAAPNVLYVDVQETGVAADATLSALGLLGSLVEFATITDAPTGRGYWEPVSDAQTANWQNVPNLQSPNWTAVTATSSSA